MAIESKSYAPFLLAFAMLFLLNAETAHAEATSVDGKMTAVTVFQGQALVTREVDMPDAEGLVEVIVKNLPERILAGSLYAEPADGVEIRSVRYRVRPIEGDSREEVRTLDEHTKNLKDEQRELAAKVVGLNKREAYLNKLENFTAGAGNSDLQHGVLDAKSLIEMSGYVFEQRDEIATQRFEMRENQLALKIQLGKLQQERNILTRNSNAMSREAVVFLNASDKGASFRLSYLVSGANWSPSYNLRANEDQSEVLVEYNASVTQTSGEDWTDVAMTLSTASPSFAAKAPSLSPFEIRLVSLAKEERMSLSSRSQLLTKQKSLASNRWKNTGNISQSEDSLFGYGGGGNKRSIALQRAAPSSSTFSGEFARDQRNLKEADDALNLMANSIELYDFNNYVAKGTEAGKSVAPRFEEGMSVVYKLTDRTSLPSRPDTQLIQIASLPIKAESYRIALPVLTKYVYQEAKLVNNTDLVLLAGPAATFLGDRFVGRGEVPSVSKGQSFTVGLGIDESFRVTRELLAKSERLQGANRIVTCNYGLTIENFGDQEVPVRLLDRIPTSKKNEIKIALGDTSEPLSEDENYRLNEHKEGILRWDLTVPAQAISKDRVLVEYSVQMEYDKNMLPTNVK